MVDVLERTMDSRPASRGQISWAIREQAARVAVSDVPMDAKDIGVSADQADIIQEAFRLGLLRDVSGARAKLISSGLEQETISQLIAAIEKN